MSSKEARENVQQLLDSLRDAYIAYKETSGRCKVEMKPKNNSRATQSNLLQQKQSEFQNFYVQPRVIQLEEPEKQKRYRKDYIAEVCARPEAEPIKLIADELHFEELSQVANHSHPSVARSDLCVFFRRFSVQLQHKKYKMLGRWANQATQSEIVDKQAMMFDKMLSRLQKEFDSALQRSERLAEEDAYTEANDPNFKRPQPTSKEEEIQPTEGSKVGEKTLLYVESTEKIVHSSIRHDDIEVFLRITTYRNSLFKVAEKLACSIKWLPFSRRFDIWTNSRIAISEYKTKYNEQRNKLLLPVTDVVKQRLIVGAGVQDEKLLYLVSEKYIQHLKQEVYSSRNQAALNCYQMTHERPPLIVTSNVELNVYLVPLANEFSLQTGEFLEMDDGHNFSYQVQGLFAPKFQQQVLRMQFDVLDTGDLSKEETDVLLIQKLTTELSLSKNEMLSEMARQFEIERSKSILGRLGKNGFQVENSMAKKSNSKEQDEQDHARNNLIRRIKEMKIFSLDETDYKLVKADWLPYVCWQPSISDFVKKQNNLLSNKDENPIDSLLLSSFEFTDVNEAGATNKILEDAATAHLRKVKSYFSELSKQFVKEPIKSNEQAIRQIMTSAISNGKIGAKANESKQDEPQTTSYNSQRIEGFLQNVDPLKHNLVKSYYTLRLLKSRDMKCQLIQALNYFRAVQKRLAFDVREFYSRERALGGQNINDGLIGPQFGKDNQGNLRAKACGTQGPGHINVNRLIREYDMSLHLVKDEHGNKTADPISLKGYKYNKRFNPDLTSTCPCLPKYHTTFGRPTLYEEVSEEIERTEAEGGEWRNQASPIVSYKDRLIFHKSEDNLLESQIEVLDQHGIRIVYEESFNDMLQLEEEMLKIGSYFLNKDEILQHTNPNETPATMIDRGEVTNQLIQQELKLHIQKIELVEILLDVYENTVDPLESVRLIQVISDIMAIRPRINLEATYFNDSYSCEQEALKIKISLYREVIELQKQIETAENDKVRKFQELKFRKLAEYCKGKWAYKNQSYDQKVVRVGAKEEAIADKGVEVSMQTVQMKRMEEAIKKKTLLEIQQRHITEFAGEQATDFANVLGLPQITISDLFKKQGQMDPVVIDSIREHTHFSKQIEGYPWFMEKLQNETSTVGLHTEGQGLYDFFESLCSITRITAACDQAIQELITVHRPENGLAASALEVAMLNEACGCMRVIRSQFLDKSYSESPAQGLIEEDFYLSSPDKLVFMMRELKSELNPDKAQDLANPFHVAKLPPCEVAKFDFPRLKPYNVENFNKLSENEVVEKMIELAKRSVSRTFCDDPRISLDDEDQRKRKVQAPSLLEMGCNTVEAVRLRNDLIQIQHEVNVLSQIYQDQLQRTNKTTWKLMGHDPIPFEIQSIAKDNMNYVDKNDGSNLEFGIEIQEFDSNIMACMNFRSESCIKALMIHLGVEELRAVVHYQLMQKQLLQIGVLRNQALLDGSLQGFEELELLKHKPCLTVPGSMIRVNDLLLGSVDGIHFENSKNEQTRLSTSIAKEAGEHMYSIATRKSRYRQLAQKKYTVLFQRIQQMQNLNSEAKLRILRSFRVSLTHEFCANVLNEVYKDSLSVQLLLSLRELRYKCNLFPRGTGLFKMRIGAMQEHLPYAFTTRQEMVEKGPIKKEGSRGPNLEDMVNGGLTNLFYIPASVEAMELIRIKTQEQLLSVSPLSKLIVPEDLDPMEVDSLLWHLTQPPKVMSFHKIQMTQAETKCDRQRTFEQANLFQDIRLDLLQFYNNLLQIVQLEYLMGRNDAAGSQILALESKVLSGIDFWKSENNQNNDNEEEEGERLKSASEKVVNRIMNAKKAQQDMSEDLFQIVTRLEIMNYELIKKASNPEHLRLTYVKNLLKHQHQCSYSQFLCSLEQCLDIYLDHHSNQNFQKMQAEIFEMSRRDFGFNLLGNGMYLNQSSRRSIDVNPSSRMLLDYDQFKRSYQPMIDEQAMIPHQIGLVEKIYGQQSHYQQTAYPHQAWSNVSCYQNMQSAFFNLDDDQRSFISSNYQQLDDSINSYLIFQGLISDPTKKPVKDSKGETKLIIHRPLEILQARSEFLGQKVESKHLQRVLMSWFTGKAVPFHIVEFIRSQKQFRDNTMLKTLLERDFLIEQYYALKEGKSIDQSVNKSSGKRKEKQTILESVNVYSREHTIINQLFQTKGEITVCKQVLDVEMIKISLDIITAEQASFAATFEQGAADNMIHALVHPTQQFASTLYQSVDKNSHLNVVNKVEFVQSFLTKLRNRCTEVETLASGPGIVFSIKDFNECLQQFCQGLLKYSEVELRTRVETARIRENQYQHLLYMKEKSALYYRRKCDQFLEDIDKLVNAKISQKGGQLLYELDVSSRELRVLRDNYRLMERMMKVELRHEFIREIQERDDIILRLKDAYKEEKSRVSKTTIVEIESDFKNLLEKVEKKGQAAINMEIPITRTSTIHKSFGGGQGSVKNMLANTSLQSSFMIHRSNFEGETLREVLGLQNYIRKYKAFVMMKNVLQIERHEKELANQRAQLTSNAALWDQLAEAEKREQITKQELNLTKLSLASYEKLIEKLQGQLENLNNQKQRLQQYKNTKSKRIDELENKMKDLEILENIDLNKILTELRNRDKKIQYLQHETKAQKNELDFVVNQNNNREIQRLMKELAHEKELKNQAYERLEAMRIEIRTLEAQDNKSDLWKEKCKEMFDICKELETENEQLKLLIENQNIMSPPQEIDANLNVLGSGALSKSMGFVGGKTSLPVGDRYFSNRTVGQSVVAQKFGANNTYTMTPGFNENRQRDTSLPSVYISGQFETKPKKENDMVLSSNNQTTLNSQNMYSRGNSGYPGYYGQENPDAMSVKSQVPIAGTLHPVAIQNPASTITGGVLGGPLQQFNQQRNIMTAGGFGRQRLKQSRQTEELTGKQSQINAKRLQTSQGARGTIGMTVQLSKKGSMSIAAPQQQKNKRLLLHQNQGLTPQTQHIASLNMLGKRIGIEVSKQKDKGQQMEGVNFNLNLDPTNINIQN